MVKYWAVVDDLAANPTKSLNLLDPVARDQARAQMQTLLGTYAAKGLTQEQLALEAEVDRTYVSQIERCLKNPSLLILHRLAKALDSVQAWVAQRL